MEFLLDFTKHVPFKYTPSYQQATSFYVQTISQAPMDIQFRQQRPGLFQITVKNEKDSRKLEVSHVLFSFGKHQENTVKVHFTKLKPRQFYENPKWINIDRLYNSSLQFAKNEDLDKHFEQYGAIIVPCHEEKEAHGFTTGRKKLRLDLKKDIERWQVLEMKVNTDEHERKDVKGRVRIQYSGQPVLCRECNINHTQKCPNLIRQEAEEADREKQRIEETSTLMIGDSNMRRINEKAFKMRTDCATGAKIGHIANSLQYYEADEKTEEVIVHVGQNNVLQEDVELGTWETQVKSEVAVLKKEIRRFKKSVVVGVPTAPWCERNEATVRMREIINKSLKEMSKDLLNSKYVVIENHTYAPGIDDTTVGELLWEDERHMTETMTAYTMSKIEEAIAFAKEDFRVIGPKPTSQRKYGGVTATYRMGCERCTRTGHSQESCKDRKRPASSGSPPNQTKNKKSNTKI